MHLPRVRPFPVLAALIAIMSISGVAHAVYRPPTELMGKGGPVTPLKNAAMIVRTEGGYRYIAGQQNSHLTVTKTRGKLRYVDTGTAQLRAIPGSCSRRSVSRGIAAVCSIPARFPRGRMLLEVWPRLGNDFVNGSGLSARFRLWVLADAGIDTVYGGDGNDFVNGAQDHDTVWGGAGNDWIRGGTGRDKVRGGTGADRLVAGNDHDVVRGGSGSDRVGGGTGGDDLWTGPGRDRAACGAGRDAAHIVGRDRTRGCESVTRR